MFSNLFSSICQVGIFMICAQAIVHFRPKGAYEKYLKILVSVMVLIQIFLPISSLFSDETQADILTQVEQFEQSLAQSMENAEKSVLASEELAERMATKQVQDILQEQESKEQELIGEETQKQGEKQKTVEKIQIKVGQ